MTDAFVVVPAAYVFLLRPSDSGIREVLLQLRRGTGYRDEHWAAAAAGHVERGESVEQAARREAAEEVGITDVELTPWCAMQRTGATGLAVDERVDYFFVAESWSGIPSIMEPDKSGGLDWFPLNALPEPVVPHELQVLRSLLAGSTPPVVTFGFPVDD